MRILLIEDDEELIDVLSMEFEDRGHEVIRAENGAVGLKCLSECQPDLSYHAWLRLDQACSLDDRSSCPRTVPIQLTPQEIATAYDMATAMELRHMPIRALALYASAHRQGVRGAGHMGPAHP